MFEDRKFPTATGRVNLITEYQHPNDTINTEFPLRLMAISTSQAQAHQWPSEKQEGPATLTIHPSMAGVHQDNAIVQIESSMGQLQVRLRLDANQRKDVALMDKGGWVSKGRCANVITPAELTDNGQCAVYYDTPVRVL